MVDVTDSTQEHASSATRGLHARASAGLRVRPQRPIRALFAALLIAASVAVAVTVYARLGDRHDVLALQRTVLAGEQVTDADLRVVSLSSDDAFTAVPASQRTLVVGEYARVRMVAGSLLVAEGLQSKPLVDPSKVLMSVAVPATGIPSGLREGSRVVLIVTPRASGSTPERSALVEASVAAVPSDLGQTVGAGASSVSEVVALSVEVPPDRVELIGSASAVAIGVLDPSAAFPTGQRELAESDGASDSAAASVPAAPTTVAVG